MIKNEYVALLIIEDDEDDQDIIRMLLEASLHVRFEVTIVSDIREGLDALSGMEYDAVVTDLNLPDSNGFATVKRVKDAAGGVPLIILTGNDDEKMAIEAVKYGAQDYLPKEGLTPQGIERAVLYSIERNHLLEELRKAREEIKTLKGIIPICSYCKKIRDDKGYWERLENYLLKHSDAVLTHGICPDCMEKRYEELKNVNRHW